MSSATDSDDRPGFAVTTTALAVIAFLQIPVIVVVLAAFSTTSYLTIPPRGLTLAWFGKVLTDPTYLAAIRMSLMLACGSTVISLLLGVAAAYALFRKALPGSEAITSVLMAPLIQPGLVAGALFAFITSLDNVPVTIFLIGANQTTLPVLIFSSVEMGIDPSVAAVSTLLIVATGIILLIAERGAGFHRFV